MLQSPFWSLTSIYLASLWAGIQHNTAYRYIAVLLYNIKMTWEWYWFLYIEIGTWSAANLLQAASDTDFVLAHTWLASAVGLKQTMWNDDDEEEGEDEEEDSDADNLLNSYDAGQREYGILRCPSMIMVSNGYGQQA